MENKIQENTLLLYLEKELYTKEVLAKCFYWYGADYEVSLSIADEKHFCVTLSGKADTKSIAADANDLIARIKRDLSDYQLREILNKETHHIRNLLVAKAFAYYEEEDEDPDTEVSDPVGFNPLAH